MSHTETTEAVERLVEEFDRKFPQYVELEVSSALGSRTLYATDWLRTALTTIRKETLEEVHRKYVLVPKRSKADRAKDDAWNDLGNTLRNGV